MGGEEFLLVYRQISIVEGALRSERIVQAWRSREPLSTLSRGRPTPGGAVAVDRLPACGRGVYLAKSKGRDQVAIERRTGIRLESVIENPSRPDAPLRFGDNVVTRSLWQADVYSRSVDQDEETGRSRSADGLRRALDSWS